MALRTIVTEGDPILNKTARAVTNFDERLWQLLDDMKETLLVESGVGLAAPQVGVLRRVFICLDAKNVELSENEINDEEYNPEFLEFVNPEIISKEGDVLAYEGCLSFPGHNAAIHRPEKVKIRAFDRFGNPFTMEGTEMLARCMCHENNHLDGVTIMELAEYFFEDQDDDDSEDDE
ncbi:MAG: peptide deformylase [Oscillospiraceae bacterium]